MALHIFKVSASIAGSYIHSIVTAVQCYCPCDEQVCFYTHVRALPGGVEAGRPAARCSNVDNEKLFLSYIL